MAVVATEEAEWGWNAVKNWWNPSSISNCREAEKNLIEAFVDDSIYEYESKQIPINYDPEPISSKQKKHQRSQTFSFFSSSNDTQSIELLSTKMDEAQYIHTLSFRVKQHQLQSFHHKNNTNVDIMHHHNAPPRVTQDELKTDGTHINGQSTNRFFQRTVSQSGSSTYITLQKHFETYSRNTAKGKRIAPIVLTHGYGCAGGYYIHCIPTIYDTLLSNMTVEESPVIHIVDWLGNGMSSRPEFECENSKEAEDFFVDSLEEWRKAMNIDRMILSGHSLGAYVCCVYAMRYPQRIEHLILVSPVGVPKRPENADQTLSNYSWKVRTMFKTFGKLWGAGWTPHDVVRLSGPKGKALIQTLVQRRLFRVDDGPFKTLLADYLYHAVGQKGSGEYALNKILQPGAWAYNPLAIRIGTLKRFQNDVKAYESYDVVCREEQEEQKGDGDGDSDSDIDVDSARVMNSNLKIDFIYGETDWMTSGHAVKLKQNGVIKCDVYINPNCGHQLIAENGQGFGQLFGGVIAKGQICL